MAYAAEVVNKQAPFEVDYMTTLVSCEFDGKKFIYNYELNEKYVTIPEIKESDYEREFRSSLQQNWDEDPELEAMKAGLKKIGGIVVYEYIGNTTGESITIEIDFE